MIESIPTIVQFILGLALLVGIHEGGHMFFAKLFGMRVEKFSIGFGPVLFWFEIGETKYQLAAIPLGGYVKISGMVDESLDTDHLEKEPESWEFRSKPAWQRLLVMLGGIIFNVILGCLIFGGMLFHYGESYTKLDENQLGIISLEVGDKLGFEDGDKVLQIDGRKIETSIDLVSPEVYFGEKHTFLVEREGNNLTIESPEGYSILNDIAAQKGLVSLDFDFKIDEVPVGSRADKAGFIYGDVVKSIDGVRITSFAPFRRYLKNHAGEKVRVEVERADSLLSLYAFIGDDGKLGVHISKTSEMNVYKTNYGIGEAIVAGAQEAFFQVYFNLKGLQAVVTGQVEVKNGVGGIRSMANAYGDEFNLMRFWFVCGMLSMALALFNLFPIPALDGGHVVFLLFEIISGKKPSQKFQETAVKFGIFILLSLMIVVNVIDFTKDY